MSTENSHIAQHFLFQHGQNNLESHYTLICFSQTSLSRYTKKHIINQLKKRAQLLDADHVVRKSQSLTSPPGVRQVSMTAEQSKTAVDPWLQHRADSSHCGTLHLMKFRSLLSCQSAGSMTALSTFFHPRQIISETATLRCLLSQCYSQLSNSDSATPSRHLDSIEKKGQIIVMHKSDIFVLITI